MSEHAADNRMDWLVWLHQIDPDCPDTAAALKQLSGEFPQLIVDREFDLDAPRFDVKWVKRESPWTAEELLDRPAKEWLPELAEFDGEEPLGASLQRLLDQVQEAGTREFDWGIELADALTEGQHWDAALWGGLLEAWATDIDEAEYRQVLSRLSHLDLHRHHTQSICRVLSKLVSGGGRPCAAELLSAANDLAISLWEHARNDADTSENLDWFTLAINRAAGPLAEFWLGSLSVALREELVDRGQLEAPYRSALDAIVQDETPAGRMARAILMSGFTFLLNVDEAWTRENLAPLLMEPVDSDEFQASWDGLMYGSLDVSTVDVLKAPFLYAASRVRQFQNSHTREQFIDYLTGLIIDFVESPTNKWIPEFLRNAGHDERRRFAWAIWRHLGELSDSEQQELWNRWLLEYWKNRIDNVPMPLEDAEIEWMHNWLPRLHSLFPVGVEFALRMPPSSSDAFFLLRKLCEGDHCEEEPEAVVDLLVRLSDAGSATPPFSDWCELTKRLAKSDLSEDRRKSLQELRLKLGIS